MLSQATKHWAALQPYRNERLRCKRYTYGDQWKDLVSVDGRRITEEQLIREEGNAPLKNNLIRRIVRNVVGVFRTNYQLPKVDVPPHLQEAYQHTLRANSYAELYCRVLEEYLIGGLAVVKKRIALPSPSSEGGVFTDVVRPDSFFFNTDAVDPRGWDINLIGEVHSLPDAEGEKVVEIWRLEPSGWRYYFISGGGEILRQGDSPFPLSGHPYVMKAYPFIDGEIHSFVADCIDQQRYINRLITLNDWVIRAGAKGVLLFPESAIPDDLELDDIAEQWSRYNGVIRFRAKAGVPLPQQVSTNASNVGIGDLLSVQLKMMEDVSGINAALQGQLSSSNVSGTLYEQQTRHALTGLSDILEGYRVFIRDSADKDLEFLSLLSS